MTLKQLPSSKIFEQLDQFQPTLERWRFKGYRLVFTNGCFDVLHAGHIHLLSSAKGFGDKLIVGLNSDDSVRALKGPSRPINHTLDRATLLASLIFVDAVIVFEEATPLKLIEYVQPQVLVKGGDYQLQDIVGADTVLHNGGKVEIVPFKQGYSSTSIIDKGAK
ncbi:MAG: D-glycero-beta-D-manno-heptose 1-phosphate adenylyltransferase [Chitinophagales bacterium]|nr:D-glycero-beta-D-manno-heptose 1-phosphate adenylyltransferase [Chitinophagales bacterium]